MTRTTPHARQMARRVECPTCHAEPGKRCPDSPRGVHPARFTAAVAALVETADPDPWADDEMPTLDLDPCEVLDVLEMPPHVDDEGDPDPMTTTAR